MIEHGKRCYDPRIETVEAFEAFIAESRRTSWTAEWQLGRTPMLHINEAKLTTEIMRIAGGRILLAVLGALAIGVVVGAVFF